MKRVATFFLSLLVLLFSVRAGVALDDESLRRLVLQPEGFKKNLRSVKQKRSSAVALKTNL
jgi:hypothetical protein